MSRILTILEKLYINDYIIYLKNRYDGLNKKDKKHIDKYLQRKTFHGKKKVDYILGESNKKILSFLKENTIDEIVDIIMRLENIIHIYNESYKEKKYLECYELFKLVENETTKTLDLIKKSRKYIKICKTCLSIPEYIHNPINNFNYDFYKCNCNIFEYPY